jgi:transposase
MSFQGTEFTTEMKRLVVSLKLHFDDERRTFTEVSTRNPTLRTAKGLGIGEATVKRIMADYRKQGYIVTEDQDRTRGKPAYSMSCNLQTIVREYIRENNKRGKRVGIEKLRGYLAQEHNAEIPTTTLWRALQRWGFVHGEGKRRSALKEREYVVLARREYIRRRRNNRNSDGTLKRPEVYLDETFINKNHTSRFTWYLEEDGPLVNKPSGKGPRMILVHAITEHGWVNGAELMFEATRRTGDYHGAMDWGNFSKWFCGQLLPNIPKNSIIILDNAGYHNVLAEDAFPQPKHTKEQLQAWLTRNKLHYSNDMLKPELFELCKRFAPNPEFALDKLAEDAGHSILRTPQYHPELQPIETCWAVVKNYMADHCDFTLENFRRRLPVALSRVTEKTTRGLIAKVRLQEDKFWNEDELLLERDNDKK